MAIPSCGGLISKVRGKPGRAARARLAALLWLALAGAPGPATTLKAADYPLEIIALQARLPEDLIPVLAPLAGPDGTLVGSGNSLFVRASPARLADIRRALATLDRPPHSLLIQVRQSASSASAGMGAGARVDEPLGREGAGRVRVGPPGSGGSGAGAWAGQGAGSGSLSQEVRALDGRPAYISVGQEQSVPFREIERGPRGAVSVREGTAYRRAESGFYVVPRVLGETVTLEISAGTAVPDRRGGLATSAAGSQVRGRLGDWIAVGGSAGTGDAQSAGVLYGGRMQSRSEGRIELRVLPLD